MGIIQGLFEKKSLWLARIMEIGNSLPSSRIYLNNVYPAGAQPAQTAAAPQAPAGPGPGGPQPTAPPGAPPGPEAPPPGMAPGAPEPPPAGPAPAQVSAPSGPPSTLPENIGVLTLDGEVVATDIRSAFSDLKIFVQKLSKLEFFSEVNIDSCELDRETGKLKFLLTAKVK